MKRPHNLAPQAIRDVESAADWLADSPGGETLARRFAKSVGEAADRVARHPLLGHRRPELLPDPYRFHAVKGFAKGFDQLLVYNAAREGAPVARVLYMGRDLGPLLDDLRQKPDTPQT